MEDHALLIIRLVVETVGGETWERSWDVLRPAAGSVDRLADVLAPRMPLLPEVT